MKSRPGFLFPIIATAFCLSLVVPQANSATIPCTPDQTKIAKAALANAGVMLATANAAIKSEDPASVVALVTWMGVANSAQKNAVLTRLETMLSHLKQTNFVCDNMTHADRKKNIFASVNPTGGYLVKLGALFFRTPETGFDSQAGVVIHEFSHFLLAGGGTIDTDSSGNHIYGTEKVRELAKKKPADAQLLADAYEYLAESIYFKLP